MNIDVGIPKALINNSRIKIDVRIEPFLYKVFVLQSNFFEFQSKVKQRRVNAPEFLQHLMTDLSNNSRSRIMSSYKRGDRIPSVGNGSSLSFALSTYFFDVFRRPPNLSSSMLTHRFVCPAMQPAPRDARDSRGDGGEQGFALRAANHTDGRCAAVLLVIRVQNKQKIQRFRADGVDLEFLGGHRKKHVQQVIGITQFISRIGKWLPERMFVCRRGNGWNLGDHSVRKDIPVSRIMDVGRVVIERGHRAHDTRDHGHRMRVVVKPV